MCKYLENSGYGPLAGSEYSPSWYVTNQFMLEVIFHEKMKRYECLTRNSSLASAIYVSYYAGLDFRRNLRRRNVAARDAAGKELFKWLTKQPQWKGTPAFYYFVLTPNVFLLFTIIACYFDLIITFSRVVKNSNREKLTDNFSSLFFR